MDKLRRMEIFVAVAEAGQFTRASKALSVSKSAVSHAINDLENYLKVQLITRSNRGLQLTEAGQSYYRKCRKILTDIDGLEEDTRQVQEIISGRIRVSAPTAYGAMTLVPLIAEFKEQYPDINIEMDMSERMVDILEEGFDLAVRIGKLSDSSLVARKLSVISSNLYASPDFAKAHSHVQTLQDMKDVNCLKYVRTPVWNLYANEKLHSFTPQGTIISNSGEAIREFAIAGCGVAFMPEFLSRQAVDAGRLVRFLPEYVGRSLNVNVVMPPHRHRPVRVRRLIDFLVERYEAAA